MNRRIVLKIILACMTAGCTTKRPQLSFKPLTLSIEEVVFLENICSIIIPGCDASKLSAFIDDYLSHVWAAQDVKLLQKKLNNLIRLSDTYKDTLCGRHLSACTPLQKEQLFAKLLNNKSLKQDCLQIRELVILAYSHSEEGVIDRGYEAIPGRYQPCIKI